MDKTRVIYLDIDDKEQFFNFGTYALIMYYASQLNISKAQKLFDTTISEYNYRRRYSLAVDDISEDDETAHFILGDIQDTIDFITDQLIPALSNEPSNLLKKYGGKDAFEVLFGNNVVDHLQSISLYSEFYDDDPKQLVYTVNRLKDFLQYSLNQNRAYTTWIQ